MKKAATIFVAVALAAFGIAACGGDDDEDETTAAETTATATDTGTAGGGGAATTLDVSAPADGSFAFEPKSLTAKAGPVTINFDNPASLSHDLILTSQDGTEAGKTQLISKSKESFTVDLKPGTYTYICDVPGHEEGGMKGTLKVN